MPSWCGRCRSRIPIAWSWFTCARPDLESPGTYRNMVWSYPKYQVLREHQQTFESLGAYTGWIWNVTGSGSPERLVGEMVDADYLVTLGIRRGGGPGVHH